MIRSAMFRVAAIAIVLFLALLTQAAEWGDLTLRIVYDSDKLPKPQPVAIAAGVAFCGGLKDLKTDDLLVNPKDRGVANVFVYLYEDQVTPHPDYAKSAKKDAIMANKGCAFEPKALTMRLRASVHRPRRSSISTSAAAPATRTCST